ncbi:MAG TPA: hypothetical protein VNX26_12960 [Candidatus Acidoferrum sp.]|nr:hypothetical protein [Candidatus Acidoferrum sp.]
MGEGPGIGAVWLAGILDGLGLLGALLWDMLALDAALEAALDETLGEGLGAGAGGGLLGAAAGAGLGGGLLGAPLVEECCANTAEEKSNITATTRLESRITHLLPTEQSERGNRSVFLTLPSTERISQKRVKERKDSVENCHVRFSKIPAAPMPPPTHMVTMP